MRARPDPRGAASPLLTRGPAVWALGLLQLVLFPASIGGLAWFLLFGA